MSRATVLVTLLLTTTSALAQPAPVLEKLPGVDLAGLDDGQKRWLRELLEQYPSLCGKSHSLLTSLNKDPACKRSGFGARHLVALLKDGLMKSECEERYEKRFVNPEKGRCEASGSPARGDAKAPVTLCIFSDFQCPFCRVAEPVLSRALVQYPGKVKVLFKNYPLTRIHAYAAEAAATVVAAGKQGKFWEMHDRLFANQDKLTAVDLEKHAAELKLDVKRWKSDLPAAREQVERERREGEKLELTGTPTIYINDRRYTGALQWELVKDWIEEELSR